MNQYDALQPTFVKNVMKALHAEGHDMASIHLVLMWSNASGQAIEREMTDTGIMFVPNHTLLRQQHNNMSELTYWNAFSRMQQAGYVRKKRTRKNITYGVCVLAVHEAINRYLPLVDE